MRVIIDRRRKSFSRRTDTCRSLCSRWRRFIAQYSFNAEICVLSFAIILIRIVIIVVHFGDFLVITITINKCSMQNYTFKSHFPPLNFATFKLAGLTQTSVILLRTRCARFKTLEKTDDDAVTTCEMQQVKLKRSNNAHRTCYSSFDEMKCSNGSSLDEDIML